MSASSLFSFFDLLARGAGRNRVASDLAFRSVSPDPKVHPPTLLIFSALNSPPFRSIKLRKRRPTCRSCGDPSATPSTTVASSSTSPSPSPLAEGEGKILDLDTEDYVTFCGGPSVDWAAEGMVEGTGGLRRAGVKVRSASDFLFPPFLASSDSFIPSVLISGPRASNLIQPDTTADHRRSISRGVLHRLSS